ncbi:MAG: DUF4381 family protein [Phyllobacterium sp.]
MADMIDPLNALQAIRLPAIPESSLWEHMAAALFAGVLAAIVIQLALGSRNRKKAQSLEQSFIIAIRDMENLPADERLAAQASIIRRYVNIVAGNAAAQKQGEDWLEELDTIFKSDFFCKGAGRVLLDGLYSRQPVFETAGIGTTLCDLLQGRKQ